jgi:hypothetical protein
VARSIAAGLGSGLGVLDDVIAEVIDVAATGMK